MWNGLRASEFNCFRRPPSRYRFLMIVYQIYQSMDKFLDMADMYACSAHQIYAKDCRLLDYCNALDDPGANKLRAKFK